MKKSELRQIIREESKSIVAEQKLLKEFDPYYFELGQNLQRSLDASGPVILSFAEKAILIATMISGLGTAGWIALAKEINPIKAVKQWFSAYRKHKDLAPILARLKDDPEIQKFVKNKNLRGIQKVIDSKLQPEEKKYLKSITRTELSK